METSIVILAAGLGTRMKSKRAKVLHRAGGLSLVEHVVHSALGVTSPERVVVVVGHQAEEVRALLAPLGVRFATQTEQKGTGHAVMMCGELLASDPGFVLVAYGDCPLLSAATFKALIERQKQSSTAGATLVTTQLDDPTGYGRILLDEQGNVRAIVEQKAATPEQLAIRLVNSGIYCFRSDLLWKHIGRIEPNNPAHEYYLTDMAELLTQAGHPVQPFEIQDPKEILGINTRLELAEADQILRERKVRQLMLDGVTIEKPETVTIDSQVQIGRDTIVESFARITGKTVIGEDCTIGSCSVLSDSTLGIGVQIAPFTCIAASTVDSEAHVGPFSRLRMGAHVESHAHVGNFVELKKTHLGAGAKASHLAYLGDSDIGERVNIGAGTITCNYDGAKKHKTTIGKGAFIGSNSTLVAPIEIGEGSYIGAGSVITDPVPAKTLALGRARQVNKEGWVKKAKT
jgi:bifunctional UDP-N-acetylglucosamine pyrophosphorylase / glucosamine-1-phosphate N-acetyltransferase